MNNPLLSVGDALLGTTSNLVIIGFYYFFMNVCLAFQSSGLVWYLPSYGMSLLYISIAQSFASICQTYTQIGVGYFGDEMKSKYGRRKPIVLFGAIGLMLSAIGIANPLKTDQNFLLAWLTVWLSLSYCAFTFQNIPLSSWIIESSSDNADYVRITTTSASVGSLLGYIAGLLGLQFSVNSKNLIAVIAVAGYSLATCLLLWYVPNKAKREVTKQPELIPSLRTCLRTREFQTIFVNRILIVGANSISLNTGIYLVFVGFPVFTKYAQIEPIILILTVLLIMGGLVLTVALNWVLARMDKLRLYKNLTLVVALLMFSLFFISLSETEAGFYGFVSVLSFVGMLAYPMTTLDSFFLKDLVIYDTFLTGLNRENMYQTAIQMPAGLADNIFTTIPNCIFFASGYVQGTNAPTDDQLVSKFIWDETVLWEWRSMCAFFVAAIAVTSYCIIRRHPLNDKVAQQISDVVKARDASEGSDINDDSCKRSSGVDEGGGSLLGNGSCGHIDGKDGQERGGGGRSSSGDTRRDATGADYEGHQGSSNRDTEQLIVDSAQPRTKGERDAASLQLSSFLVNGNVDSTFMNHFSALEVKNMSQRSQGAISELQWKISGGMALGMGATGAMVAGFVVQLEHGLQTFIAILISLVLMVSFYVLYEALRLRALFRLRQCGEERVDVLIRTAHRNNQKYAESLKDLLARNGIADDGAEDDDLSRIFSGESAGASSAASRKTTLSGQAELAQAEGESESAALSGYKRIYLLLVACAVFGVLNATVLISEPRQPANHTPSYSPTLLPTG